MTSLKNYNRTQILAEPDLQGIKEALSHRANVTGENLMLPIRETPLSVFFDKSPHSMENERTNPNLPRIWKSRYGVNIGEMNYGKATSTRETVSVPNSLSALKIYDTILEGAEPFSDWKQYTHLVNMDTPQLNVPITKYTDTVTGSTFDSTTGVQGAGIEVYAQSGGTPKPIGGKVETVELDCSGNNNSYRGTITVERNDVHDNNFLAVEQSLKNAGNEFYFLIGEKLIRTMVDAPNIPSATKASLDSGTPSHSELEALIEVIRGRFPGRQRNRADTLFIHPEDAALAVKNAGTNGQYPLLSRFILGPTDNTDVVNNSGLAQTLGLRNVWETPQIKKNTVLITKRDIASVTGLREDLTIENFDLTVGGIYDSDLLVRFDPQVAHIDVGAFKITAFET